MPSRAAGPASASPRDGTPLRGAAASATAALLLALLAACPPPPDGAGDGPGPRPLPQDPLACLRLADEWSQTGTSREKKLEALAALDHAQSLGSDPYVTEVLRARTLFRLAEENETDARRGEWLDAALAAARRAAEIRPERVEGHYYVAAVLGRVAERATVGALDMIPQILAAAERSVEIDRTYDNCGPLVALGMLYIAAPPWPQSIGDPETGIEYLRQAVECSDFPVNRIMLAEALLDQGEFEEARDLLRWVLSRPPEGDWGVAGNKWRPIARELLDRAEHPGQ
ncbi:MAG: hypothetical protein GYA57_16085 [Myxococcales bacterium]|nr:hypothetical protein [Myxococcales bacterium]